MQSDSSPLPLAPSKRWNSTPRGTRLPLSKPCAGFVGLEQKANGKGPCEGCEECEELVERIDKHSTELYTNTRDQLLEFACFINKNFTRCTDPLFLYNIEPTLKMLMHQKEHYSICGIIEPERIFNDPLVQINRITRSKLEHHSLVWDYIADYTISNKVYF